MTSIGRGLTDFDDCTRGKPVIDLVRFGTSIVLASRQKGWKDEQRPLREFLRATATASAARASRCRRRGS